MQAIIVGIIVLVAAVVVLRRIVRFFRTGETQGCGCSDCSKCPVHTSCEIDQHPDPVDRTDGRDKESGF